MHWLGLLLIVIGLLQRLLPLGPHSRRVVPGERKGAGPSRRIVYFSAEPVGVGKVVSVVVSHLNNNSSSNIRVHRKVTRSARSATPCTVRSISPPGSRFLRRRRTPSGPRPK